MSEIPYDEMRRLCGLPDIQTLDMLAAIRKYGLNHFLNIGIQMGWFDDIWELPDPPVESGLPHIRYREGDGIAREEFTISRDSAPLVERGRKPHGWTPPPKPTGKQTPPPWTINPGRTRRTAFGPTRRVK